MSLVPIGAPSYEPFRPGCPDLFHASTTPSVSTNHSPLYLTHVDGNHVHQDIVSRSECEDVESLVPDLFQPQSLLNKEEGLTSRPTQDGSLIDSSSISIQEESYVLDTQLDKIGGFDDCHYTENIFVHSSGEYHFYPYVDPTRPPEFDDLAFKYLGTHQEVYAL